MEKNCQATSPRILVKLLDGLFACLKLGESGVTSVLAMPCRIHERASSSVESLTFGFRDSLVVESR